MVLYGISNCDQVKKARAFLDLHHIDYQFYDFKKTAPTKALLEHWLEQASCEALINKRSSTWKSLSDDEKSQIELGDIFLVCQNKPTLIKRPVLQLTNQLIIGFSEASYQAALTKS